ncbi:MAG: Gfo/Idh/MocA family oxidoreductase [Victivallales bacterium]|nr:Gfo/Idh/MocA family oxidoreductase [Victivallales bacterium]
MSYPVLRPRPFAPTDRAIVAAGADVPKRLRWAIVGTGNISASHIRAIEQMPEIAIVAGCDIKPERLAWFRQQPGCQNAATYGDYRELLRKEKLDAVAVCTPNDSHAQITIDALKAGCHVIVEKPMAMNPAECSRMIAAAKTAKRLLAVGFQIRYTPAVQMCRRAREAGLLGDILFAKVHALRRRGIPNWGVFGQKELQGGGPMIDIGVHWIESAHFAMGEPRPVAATGRIWTYLGDKPSQVVSKWPNWDYKTYTVEDLAVGQVRFDNGAIMQIESSFCAHIEKDRMAWELLGTKGGFSTDSETLYLDQAGTMLNAHAAFLPGHANPVDFIAKLRNFTDAIRLGTPLCAPGEEGLAVQKIIDAIYRSAALGGKEVQI